MKLSLKTERLLNYPRNMKSVVELTIDNIYPLHTALVIGLTRERFVALGLPSWTHLRTRYWGVFTLQWLKDLLRGFGLCYCESWGI